MARQTSSNQPGFFDAQPTRRLFLGLWPDEGAVAGMTQLTRQLAHDGVMRGRPADPDRLHVTLFHLLDSVDQIPPSLITAVQEAADSITCAPFDVRFDRVLGTARHILLRPSDDLAALRDFRASLHLNLAKVGVRPMDSTFSPHVTLSYNPGALGEVPVEPIGWRVQGFHLVESLLGQHRHIRLDSWAL